jgi:hypothetical protein
MAELKVKTESVPKLKTKAEKEAAIEYIKEGKQ